MENLIIACGNYGSTLKAADILSRRLDGNSLIFDAVKNKSLPDFSAYDNIILGGNVHMNKLNKRFRKIAKNLKKSNYSANVYAYFLCGFKEKSNIYLEQAKKLLPFAKRIDYVGGILSAENITGFWANVIVDAREGLKKAGKSLPSLDRKLLENIAEYINTH